MGKETLMEARARYCKERAKGKAGHWVLAWSPGDVCYKIVRMGELERDPGSVGCLGGHMVLSLTPRKAQRLVAQRELGWGSGGL